MSIYAWQDPEWVMVAALLAAAPFLLAAILAPALLNFTPTVDMIAPIADARAYASGAATLADAATPFQTLLLVLADLFAETPGRVHLVAKAIAATLVAAPLAYFTAVRFPACQTVLLTGAMAAYVAAPFAGAPEIALAIYVTLATALIAAPADEGKRRAYIEGAISGALIAALWILNPPFALAGLLTLSSCPFLSGRAGLHRYATALFGAAVLAALAEFLAPGINAARAEAASHLLSNVPVIGAGNGAWGLAGVAASTAIVLSSAAIFGGREHVRSWATAALFLIVATIGGKAAGANLMPLFVLSAAIACFSVASPFYDGLFRAHDRASVAIAGSVAALTLFWTVALIVQASGQIILQNRVAAAANPAFRAELGLVQPGGPTMARWIEEGRFSTPEAREFLALAPIDQSAILLEAAARARALAENGADVAILTDADTGCVIAGPRECRRDGLAAVGLASIVLVPRIDFNEATAIAKGRAEAILYTEFRLTERTPLWEVWVRRGAIQAGVD